MPEFNPLNPRANEHHNENDAETDRRAEIMMNLVEMYPV